MWLEWHTFTTQSLLFQSNFVCAVRSSVTLATNHYPCIAHNKRFVVAVVVVGGCDRNGKRDKSKWTYRLPLNANATRYTYANKNAREIGDCLHYSRLCHTRCTLLDMFTPNWTQKSHIQEVFNSTVANTKIVLKFIEWKIHRQPLHSNCVNNKQKVVISIGIVPLRSHLEKQTCLFSRKWFTNGEICT